MNEYISGVASVQIKKIKNIRMKRTIIIALPVLLLLASCKGKKEDWVSPTVSPITEAVFAPGHIEAVDQFTLTALNDGYIKKVLVKEGDDVSINQTLFVQDNATATIQQQTASESLRIAEEQAASNSAVLQQLEAQLKAAIDKLNNDKTQLDRMQRLYTTHSVAKVDVDNAQLSYDNSVSNVKAIQQNIQATKLNLKQSVVNSRGQLQTAAVNTGYFNIKSPGNYKVYTLPKKEGELVRKGDAVAVLGNAKNLKVVLSVDESSIAKVQLNQTVLIELNTQKGVSYAGHVSKIYPEFDTNAQAYTVEAVFDTASANIINGTLLQANIIVAKKDKALLIPKGCLSPDGKVVKKSDKQKDTLSVQTGIISNDWVEILSGINQSDKVLKQY